MTEREAHVCMCRLTQAQRDRIWKAARAVRDAKCDRVKRRKADKDLMTVLRYYAALGVLTDEESRALYYTLNLNGL